MDLIALLKRPEGKTLEFKRELSTPEGTLKTIIAFANTAGGTLLFGVEDERVRRFSCSSTTFGAWRRS